MRPALAALAVPHRLVDDIQDALEGLLHLARILSYLSVRDIARCTRMRGFCLGFEWMRFYGARR
jgi:hypothetical protein